MDERRRMRCEKRQVKSLGGEDRLTSGAAVWRRMRREDGRKVRRRRPAWPVQASRRLELLITAMACALSASTAAAGPVCQSRGVYVGNPPDVVCVETTSDSNADTIVCDGRVETPGLTWSPFTMNGPELEVLRTSLHDDSGTGPTPGRTITGSAWPWWWNMADGTSVFPVRSEAPGPDGSNPGGPAGLRVRCVDLIELCVCLAGDWGRED